MNKPVAHVAQWKKDKLEELKNLISKHSTIALIDIKGIPSAQFQKIKFNLKKDVIFCMTKSRVMKRALELELQKGTSHLSNKVPHTIPILLFTQLDPFKLSKAILKNKSLTFAKTGQIAPMDLIIPAGPTQFTPGPIMGELGAAGIKTVVEAGKLVIKSPVTLVKKGQVITDKVSGILTKMNIKPIEIKLNLLAAFEKGMIYNQEVLSINEEEYVERLKLSHSYAFNLAVKIAYPTKETIKTLLAKANSEHTGLSSKLDLKFEAKEDKIEKQMEELIEEAEEEKKMTEVIKEIKDEIIEEKLEDKMTELIEEEKEEGKIENIQANEIENSAIITDKKYNEYSEKAQDILKNLQDQKIKQKTKRRPIQNF